jgi:hypothetical protein
MIIGVIVFIVTLYVLLPKVKIEPAKPCKPHKWTYDEEGMICAQCKRRPGQW